MIELSEIKKGARLEMQKENNSKFGWFDWGVVESKDIPRLKREIKRGLNLWRLKLNAR